MLRKKEELTCKQAQKMIDGFVSNSLSEEDRDAFIFHVHKCHECMDELKINYSILTALKQLDEGEDLSDNYDREVEQKINSYVDKKHFHKIAFVVSMIAVFVFSVSMGMFLTSTSTVYNDVVYSSNEENTTVSLNYDGVPDEMDPVDKAIAEYNADAINYIHTLDDGEE